MPAPWTWSPSSISNDNAILCITGDSTGQYILAGGNIRNTNQGIIFYSDNSGVSWNGPVTIDTGAERVLSVACSTTGSLMYAVTDGASGGLYYSTTHGASWTLAETSTAGDNYLSGVCCDAYGQNVVVISNKANGGAGKIWYCFDPLISAPIWSFNSTYAGQNWTSVTVNSDGTQFFAVASDNGGTDPGTPALFNSTDGINWDVEDSLIPFDLSQTWTYVAFSRNDSTAIVCSKGVGGNSSGNIYINKTPSDASAWTKVNSNNIEWNYVTLSTDGKKVYACSRTDGLYYGTSTHIILDTSTTLTNILCVYINPISGYPQARGLDGNASSALYTAQYEPPTPPLCFKEGSKILCLIDGVETYVPIETMTPGTLVKTALSGYKKVELIGFSKVYNPGNDTKSIHHLVKCTPAKYPELTEDLILTGAHSILVDDISDKQRADLQELMGDIFVTGNKYRLMACVDDRSEPYDEEGLFTIWHFALEHEKYTLNYGVYANGLLVETSSLRMMKEFSGMTLLN